MRIDLKNNRKSAFTFIEIVIVVTILGLLVAIGVPNFMRARDNSRLNCIRKNLREIESAKIQWALEHNKSTGATVTDMTVLNDYFRQNGGVRDVIRETYVPNAIGTPAEADLPGGVSLGTYAPGGVIAAD
jgi:prepilin-type N-terminal cleavage/methylation domain-containing protein